MNDFALRIEELSKGTEEPQVTFVLSRGEKEVLRREARVFSEDDMIAASNELTGAGKVDQTDLEQYMAELIEPVRIKWLRNREAGPDENQAERPQAAMPRYVAVLPDANGGEPREASIRDVVGNRVLTNFVVTLDEDVQIQD